MNFANLESISIAVALVSVLVSVAATFIAFKGRTHRVAIHINENLKPEKSTGLILLVGPSRGSAPAAVAFHRPTLKFCWLVGTEDSLSTIQSLITENEGVTFFWGDDYTVDADEVRSTYDVVSRVLLNEVPALGLKEGDVVADITGGLKPMSAGLSLACTEHQRLMQFMKAPRDAEGKVLRGGLPEPVKVQFQFRTSLNGRY